ncbi:MAG: carbohydrate ABC transporter permease [Christensenellales bacterium]|jgi:putative aldouronate transport system permease protein
MVKSQRPIDVFVDVLIYTAVIVASFLCLVPLLNTLALSFSSSIMAASGTVSFWPKQFTLAAYEAIVAERQFFGAFWISIKRVLLGGAINFVMMILCAFPLAHDEKTFKGRNLYMYVLIFTMLFSGGLVPSYILISKLGLMNSIWALVLPGAVPVWNSILLMNFFRSLPVELEEAAIIDGAVPFQILLRVYLPVSLPALATVMLFSLVGHWNEFFSGLIYMNHSDNYPLATYISTIVDSAKDLNLITDPEEIERIMKVSERNMSSAKIFVSMIPVLMIYPFLQRYFVTGIVLGSVKG